VRTLVYEELSENPALVLTKPLNYINLVATMKRSMLSLTDNDGLQEEAGWV
jgi:UDP-N-acetylglucosamine 2-epimerase